MSDTPELPTRTGEPVEAQAAVNLSLLGQILFNFGATAQRIQDSIRCLAQHLGCEVEMLVSYDALLITINDGATFRTRINSFTGSAGLNLLGLIRVSELLRGLPRSRFNATEIHHALCAIRDKPHTHGLAVQAVAAGCAGAGFCVVNGGDPVSWVSSFVAGAFIFAIRRRIATYNLNIHVTLFVVALTGTCLAASLARLTHSATPAIALIAPVLFLVPGVPMINGGIDIVWNHVTIGIARVGFTVAVLVDLWLGVGLTLPMVPRQISQPFAVDGLWGIGLVSIAGALAAGALASLSNGSLLLIVVCALGGLTGRLIRTLAILSGLDVITASLFGVVSSTVVVCLVGERFRWPVAFASVMAALPMVPGYFAIDGMHSLASFAASTAADPTQLSLSLHALTRALFISVVLVVGVIGPLRILQRNTKRI